MSPRFTRVGPPRECGMGNAECGMREGGATWASCSSYGHCVGPKSSAELKYTSPSGLDLTQRPQRSQHGLAATEPRVSVWSACSSLPLSHAPNALKTAARCCMLHASRQLHHVSRAQTPERWPVYSPAHAQTLFLFLGGAASRAAGLCLRSAEPAPPQNKKTRVKRLRTYKQATSPGFG